MAIPWTTAGRRGGSQLRWNRPPRRTVSRDGTSNLYRGRSDSGRQLRPFEQLRLQNLRGHCRMTVYARPAARMKRRLARWKEDKSKGTLIASAMRLDKEVSRVREQLSPKPA